MTIAKVRTHCRTCQYPIVARRPGKVIPKGYRPHAARGMCTRCYRSPSKAQELSPDPMWGGLPVGDVPLPTFHRYAPPPVWVEDALCAQVDQEVFFPELGQGTRAAKSICGRCDVVDACLEYALANREPFGVWGNKSAPERAELLRGVA